MDTEFGKKLREIIKKSGLSLTEFADKIGVNRSQISLWINGSRKPRPKAIREICEALNIPIDYFEQMNATQNITNVSNSSVSQFHIPDSSEIKKEISETRKDIEIIKLKLDLILEKLKKE